MEREEIISAVQELNASELKGIENYAKMSIVKLTDAFIKAVKEIPDEDESKIPDNVIVAYNILVEEKRSATAQAEKPAAPKKEAAPKGKVNTVKKEVKKEAPKKEVKKEAPKKEVERSEFGSKKGSAAYEIDKLLRKGGKTVDQIAELIKGSKAHVVNHIQDRKKKGVKIVNKEGKYYIEG
jgi:chromatin segregation and condensation protein Rec8/ScpA/Scc1 (kleisin family)